MKFKVTKIEHYGTYFIHTVGFFTEGGTIYEGKIVLPGPLLFKKGYHLQVVSITTSEPDHDPDERTQLP